MDSGAYVAKPDSGAPIHEAVRVFLLTGESDPLYYAWPGNLMERANRAHSDLRGALIDAVREQAAGLSHHRVPETAPSGLTRAKVEPMVRGLFPRVEQDQVLATLERSVVFLTDANIESILLAQHW